MPSEDFQCFRLPKSLHLYKSTLPCVIRVLVPNLMTHVMTLCIELEKYSLSQRQARKHSPLS